MKTASLLRPVKLKDGREFPQGARFAIAFDKTPKGSPLLVATLESDSTVSFRTLRPSIFFRAPSLRTMEKWMDSGIARTVTGNKTEPDGYGPDGAPSWLLALGMI